MTQRKAFTLIELLVAVGIIAVLIGLVTFALRSAGNQSRANSTRVAMENLKSMLAEMELATKFQTPPGVWYRYVPTSGWPNYDVGLWHTYVHLATDYIDFYRIVDRVNPASNLSPMRYTYAPALVTEESRSNLTEMEQTPILNTALLMYYLRTLPMNRSAVDRMPPETLTPIILQYKPGDPFDPNYPPSVPPNPAVSVPIVLDGWRNPIIFVPGTTGLLVGRIYNNAVQYRDGQHVVSNDVSYRCIQTTVGNAPPNVTYWQAVPTIVAPNNRSFFASAGPDGDFSKGDDNIYSFEQ